MIYYHTECNPMNYMMEFYGGRFPVKKERSLCIVGLGGTISCSTNIPTAEFYDASHSNVTKLVAKLSKESDLRIDVHDFLHVISHDIFNEQLIAIGRFLQCLIDSSKYDGIVVTMGTNALEDVAYFISLVVKTSVPIIFTGAHYPQQSLSFDGERNLYNAIQIASSDKAVDLGVLVTFCDYVVSARDAIKTPVGVLNNFTHGHSVVGYVVGGEFILRSKPVNKQIEIPEFHIDNLCASTKIVVIYGHLGIDSTFINFALQSGVDGIVSAGFGKGYQPKCVTDGLKKAVERGIVVVRCSRSEGYSGEDPQYDLKNGFLVSSGLSPNKVSVLLFIALSFTKDKAKLKEIFKGY